MRTMNASFFCMMLASLLLPPTLSVQDAPMDHWVFARYHTFHYFKAFECKRNLPWQNDKSDCIPSHSVILGNTTDTTAVFDVLNICRGQSTYMGGNLFRSNANFRVAKCSLEDKNATPPDCKYKPKYHTGQILVGCSRGYPVHFEGLA